MIFPNRPITLQERMRALILVSIGVVLIVIIFGFWKIRQFNQHHTTIQNSSSKLQHNLQENFTATRTLGNIQANLRLYMQSADAGVLALIRHDALNLKQTMPPELYADISHLQEIINTLAIRMTSLRNNNNQLPQAESSIAKTMAIITQKSPQSLNQQIIPLATQAQVAHHKIYVESIISGQISQIKQGQKQISTIIEDLVKRLHTIAEQLPPDQQALVNKVKDSFYWLDEASGTVAAIRLTTLQSESEIIKTVEKLKNAVTQDSLDRNQTTFTLMQKGMDLAQQNIIFLVSTLVILALLFIITSLIISNKLIQPLVEFVRLLRKLSRMMAGQRQTCTSDDTNLRKLSTFILTRRDEIGEVALAIKDMLAKMQAISFFRQTIEADESTKEIYQRLSRVFIDNLGLDMFVIYEKLQGHDSMEHVYTHPPELTYELPEFAMADNCRAKRTGTIVTSYDDPHICNMYPFPDCLDHYCVPMIVGGHVIGVIQFLFRKEMSDSAKKQVNDRIAEAKNFITETLPVLQSKHLAAEMEEMATTDQLTGLFNRRYLETSLDQIVAGVRRRGTNMGILMCDLDYFKQVNDSYGHDAGDAVLSQLSALLRNGVRNADLVIRFGGEEFLIILMDCAEDKAQDVAENIRKSVENYKFQAMGQTINKTLSIGVGNFPSNETQGIWEAIKFADVALYKAKENGRNRVEVFDPAMWEDSSY